MTATLTQPATLTPSAPETPPASPSRGVSRLIQRTRRQEAAVAVLAERYGDERHRDEARQVAGSGDRLRQAGELAWLMSHSDRVRRLCVDLHDHAGHTASLPQDRRADPDA